MEDDRFKPEDSRCGPAAIADVPTVELDVAKLFERFRLDLEQMFGRSVPKGCLCDGVTHLMTRRTRAK
jgi:hypothetical protein